MIDVLDTTTVAPTTLANSNAASVIISAIAGAISAVSINILAYAAHLERQNGHRRRVRWALPVNLVMGVVAQLIFVLACNLGPVALAMPVQTAAQLMMNMMIQVALQMKEFTKSMRVGTTVICCAILCLINVGPKDSGDLDFSDVLAMLQTKSAMVFLVCNTLITLIGGAIVWCNPRDIHTNLNVEEIRSWSKREKASTAPSLIKMSGYAAAQSSTMVLTTSLGKVLGTVTESWLLLLGIGAIWLLISLFNVVVASLASKRCDASFYVPLFAGSKLILNALAGVCIWKDLENMDGKFICYFMIYVLIIMGVYLLSSIDMASIVALRRMRAAAGEASDFQTSSMGQVAQDLVNVWREGRDAGEGDEEQASVVVRAFLQEGLDTHTWSEQPMLELASAMLRGKCSSVDPDFLGWIKANLQAETKLVQEMFALGNIDEDPDPSPRRATFRTMVSGAMDGVAVSRRRLPAGDGVSGMPASDGAARSFAASEAAARSFATSIEDIEVRSERGC